MLRATRVALSTAILRETYVFIILFPLVGWKQDAAAAAAAVNTPAIV